MFFIWRGKKLLSNSCKAALFAFRFSMPSKVIVFFVVKNKWTDEEAISLGFLGKIFQAIWHYLASLFPHPHTYILTCTLYNMMISQFHIFRFSPKSS
jgi:hypothetical protein